MFVSIGNSRMDKKFNCTDMTYEDLSAVCPRQNILRKQWSSTGRCRKGSRTISRMSEDSSLES